MLWSRDENKGKIPVSQSEQNKFTIDVLTTTVAKQCKAMQVNFSRIWLSPGHHQLSAYSSQEEKKKKKEKGKSN